MPPTKTDFERAERALQCVRTARDGLHRALDELKDAEDVGLLSPLSPIRRAIDELDRAAGDLEGELERIEEEEIEADENV